MELGAEGRGHGGADIAEGSLSALHECAKHFLHIVTLNPHENL